jgi:hypothetical protein
MRTLEAGMTACGCVNAILPDTRYKHRLGSLRNGSHDLPEYRVLIYRLAIHPAAQVILLSPHDVQGWGKKKNIERKRGYTWIRVQRTGNKGDTRPHLYVASHEDNCFFKLGV